MVLSMELGAGGPEAGRGRKNCKNFKKGRSDLEVATRNRGARIGASPASCPWELWDIERGREGPLLRALPGKHV